MSNINKILFNAAKIGVAKFRPIYKDGAIVDFEILEMNDAAKAIVNYSTSSKKIQTIARCIESSSVSWWIKSYNIAKNLTTPYIFKVCSDDGSRCVNLVSSVKQSGDFLCVFNQMQSGEIKSGEVQITDTNSEFETMFESLNDIVLHVDSELNIIYSNDSLTKVTGITRQDALSMNIRDLIDNRAVKVLDKNREEIDSGEQVILTFSIKADDGKQRKYEWSVSAIAGSDDPRKTFVVIGRDVEFRDAELGTLQYMIDNDILTGLLNRVSIQRETERLYSEGKEFAGLFLDVDNFRIVNEVYGHIVGDNLLKNIAEIIKSVVPVNSSASRISSDEFFVLFKDISKEEVIAISKRVISHIENIVNFENEKGLRITASGGIAFSTDFEDFSWDVFFSAADNATAEVKKFGRNDIRVYNSNVADNTRRYNTLLGDAVAGIENGEFSMHYQPIFSTKDMSLVGFEALMRWHHPTLGIIPPTEFIPILEMSGEIGYLSTKMFDKISAQFKEWKTRYNNLEIFMSVNISPSQLLAKDFSEKVLKIINKNALTASDFHIELVETSVLSDEKVVSDNITALRAQGVRVALDDFGIEYSTLSLLSRIQFDSIKVDRYFVSNLENESVNLHILKMIRDVIMDMHKTCIVEGVETQHQLDIVKALGLFNVQGFLFSKPSHPDEAFDNIQQGIDGKYYHTTFL